MQDFSIHDVRFRRTAADRAEIIVHGHTVGDVSLVPPPDRPGHPQDPRYRIDLYDGAGGPCYVHRRSQVRLAIADWLWNDRIVPPRIDPAILPPRQPAARLAG